jgi:NAD(P)-dependent dehydrogenase (short-subunit alcohol dehydrogenase family)
VQYVLDHPITACVFGASGGIGAAITRQLQDDPRVSVIHAGARSALTGGPKIKTFRFDLTDETSIADAAASIGPVDLIIVATGFLHDSELKPEKSFRSQSPQSYARAFSLNATGPALIGKHFLPLLPRDRWCAFAAFSARVSSVRDNRLGGWHAYRASKAALNMIVRNFAIELARSHQGAIAVTLHPGTVDTMLSGPFQANIVPGKLFTPDFAAEKLLAIIFGLKAEQSGSLIAWDGQQIPF